MVHYQNGNMIDYIFYRVYWAYNKKKRVRKVS